MCIFVEGTNEEVVAGGVEGRGFESPDGIKSLNASSVGKKMKRRERRLDSEEAFCCSGF